MSRVFFVTLASAVVAVFFLAVFHIWRMGGPWEICAMYAALGVAGVYIIIDSWDSL